MTTHRPLTIAPFAVPFLLLFSQLLTGCGAHPHLLPSTKLESAATSNLLGERWYRMELTSGQRLGFMHLKVEAAAKGSGAAYQVMSQGVFEMGPAKMAITETALLDEALAVVSLEGEKQGQTPGKEAKNEVTRLSRVADGWDRNQKGSDDHAALDVPFYDVTPGIALLIERLPLRDGARWSLPSLAWKDGQSGEKARARTITLEARAATFQHHGEKVDGFMVTITKDDRETKDLIHTDAAGRMLRLTASDAPIRLVACTEAEAKKEEVLARIDPGAPEYPLSRFLEVVAGIAEADALDEIIDWDAMFARVAEEKGGQPPTGPEREAAIVSFKAQFHASAHDLDAKMIRMVVGMVKIEIEGDQALIQSPGAGKKPFVAERRGDHWMLVSFPR